MYTFSLVYHNQSCPSCTQMSISAISTRYRIDIDFYWNMHDIPRHTQISISIMSTQYRINIVSCLKHLWQTHTYQISLSMLRDELGKIYPCVKGLQSKHIKRKKLWVGTFNIDIWTKQKKYDFESTLLILTPVWNEFKVMNQNNTLQWKFKSRYRL